MNKGEVSPLEFVLTLGDLDELFALLSVRSPAGLCSRKSRGYPGLK